MEVSVRFYGNYRPLLKTSEVRLEVEEGASALDVLCSLGDQYGEKLRRALLSEKGGKARLQAGVRMAVGDEIVDFASDLSQPFIKATNGSEPVELFIFPALVGGE
jgi:molybdopterin converting factor small subunit